MSQLKIVNWNCGGLGRKRRTIEILSRDFEIICISETKFNIDSIPLNIRNFYSIRKDSSNPNHSGGLLTFIRRDVVYVRINLHNIDPAIEYIAIKIRKNEEEFLLVHVYFNPSIYISRKSIQDFFDTVSAQKNVILTGDFNAHSPIWGSEITPKARGIIIESLLNNGDWNICNNGSPTRINLISGKKSVTDLTVVSPDIQHRILWNLGDDPMHSDHFPIFINISFPHKSFSIDPRKIRLNDIHWPTFNEKIDKFSGTFNNTLNNENYLLIYNKFVNCIIETANSFSNKKPGKKSKTPVPCVWWNPECSKALLERKEAFRVYKLAPSLINWDKYSKTAKLADRIFAKAKAESFRVFCNSLTPDSNMSEVWGKIKAFKRRFNSPGASHVENNSPKDNPALVASFRELGIIQHYGDIPCLDDPISDADLPESSKFLVKPVSTQEVSDAINSSSCGKSPGLDGISYDIIKKFSRKTIEWLTHFYNLVLSNGKIPVSWSEYKLVMIPKSGSQAFRPIALSSCFLKILEKIIADRLTWFTESRGIIPMNFFGFRYGRSCQDCLSILRTDIDIAKSKKHYFGVIFIDIKGAFNHVNIKKLLEILTEIKIPTKMVKFIANIMLSRTLVGYSSGVCIGKVDTNSGCPQGSVLSPLLFNLYISKLNKVFSHQVKSLGFADDINFYSSHTELPALTDILTNNFQSLKVWLHSINMEISLSKTRFLLYPPNYGSITPFSVTLTLGNDILYNVPSAKYLGLTWDYKLDWGYHIQNLIDKGIKLLKIMKSISAHSWGGHPTVLLSIYKGLVRPSIEWGNYLYTQGQKKLLCKLDVIQNDALRMVSGCFKTTPLNVIHHICGIEPLHVRRHIATVKFLVKKYSQVDSMLIPKLQWLGKRKNLPSSKVSILFQLWLKHSFEFQPIVRSRKNVTYSIPYESFYIGQYIETLAGRTLANPVGEIENQGLNPNQALQEYIEKEYPGSTQLYTDGSKDSDSRCGYSLVHLNRPQLNFAASINGISSIFTAEAMAIDRALLTILDNSIPNAVIGTDSLSVLETLLRDGLHNLVHPIIASIRQKIYCIIERGYALRLFWLPAHIGIEGNEAADLLAKKVSKLIIGEKRIRFFMDWFNIYSNKMNAKIHDLICTYGDQARPKGEIYIRNIKSFNKRAWFKDRNLTRKDITYIDRIRSGHCQLRAHLFRMKIVDSPSCDCGEIPQNIDHIVWFCPVYFQGRAELIRELEKNDIPIFSSVTDIVNVSSVHIAIIILRFLYQNNIFL